MMEYLYIVSFIATNSNGSRGTFCAEITLSNKWGVGDMEAVARSLTEDDSVKNVVITSIFYAGEV